jgi:PAB-dependent poly(A)-specific ribonuclease subunit 2
VAVGPAAESSASKAKGEGASTVADLWGSELITTVTCLTCRSVTAKPSRTFVQSLSAPESFTEPVGQGVPLAALSTSASFGDLLVAALYREQTDKAHCTQCGAFMLSVHRKVTATLPPVLAVACRMPRESDRLFWEAKMARLNQPEASSMGPGPSERARRAKVAVPKELQAEAPAAGPEKLACSWIPVEVEVGLQPSSAEAPVRVRQRFLTQEGQVASGEELAHGDLLMGKCCPDVAECSTNASYELLASIYHVRDAKSPGNMVALVRVPPSYMAARTGHATSAWYLFNDFAVSAVAPAEAVVYDMAWKTPCVLYFVRKGFAGETHGPSAPPLATFMARLLDDTNLAVHRRVLLTRPLSEGTVPKQGDLVALDAEFISLRREDAELRSSGHKSTLKPAHLTPARISVVCGSGPLHGCTIIDDYIKNTEFVRAGRWPPRACWFRAGSSCAWLGAGRRWRTT